jgi:hypothetical protein
MGVFADTGPHFEYRQFQRIILSFYNDFFDTGAPCGIKAGERAVSLMNIIECPEKNP